MYDHPSTFIRELIQNALDAMRCQMYADLIKDGLEPPEYPTEVDEDRRKRYPIHVGLRMEKPRGESEEHQIFSIEDHGIGMDRDVIERYLLQIGRSFYTTDEFRRSFHFVPTSRFGIGFLSVFAISDKVTVETCKTNSPSNDGPLKLTLTGPRNYLLTERGERKSNGTKIKVFLRNPMEHRQLTELITDWCKRVEFPIEVDDLGDKKTILSEHMNDFIRELPDPSEEGAKLVIKAFPIDRPWLEGELYVLARVGAAGEFGLSARGTGMVIASVRLGMQNGLGVLTIWCVSTAWAKTQKARYQAGNDFTQCVSITAARSTD